MDCFCFTMEILIICDPFSWEQKLELFIGKLSWNISAMQYFVSINFDEQCVFCLRKFRDNDVKGVVLDPISNLVMNSCCIRGGYLGDFSDLDLDCQCVECMRIYEKDAEVGVQSNKHYTDI